MLAFGLMGVVLLVSTYLMPKPPEPARQPAPKQEAPKQEATKRDAPATPAASPSKSQGKIKAPSAAIARVSAAKDESYTVETEVYKIVFVNRGAAVRSWVLKKFKDSDGKPLDLVNPKATGKVVYPFAVRFHANQSAQALNDALYAAKVSEDKLSLEFEYSDGAWFSKKTFAFTKHAYVGQVASQLKYAGVPKPHLLYWRGGFGDYSVVGAAAAQMSVRFDLSTNSIELLTAADAKGAPDGYQAHRGRFAFAGIEDAYFAAVALPNPDKEFEIHSLSDQIPNSIDGKEDPFPGSAIGGDPVNAFPIYIGPKDTGVMNAVSPRLTGIIDYGWFKLLAQPLFLVVQWFHDNYIHNYGWTIIIVTVIINMLLLPLKITSLKSMRAMSTLQPKIAAINEKYKGLSFKDPKKQGQQAEVMELYKKHGVNPMGGCMPMALQIPFFIAFYKVLSSSIELRGAEWLWVTDLSRPETLAIRILPLAMIATQFIVQKMTPSTAADPSQQKVMLMMPLFLGFMFYGVSSGLVLYWFTGNVVGIAQQLLFNRMMPLPKDPAQKRDGKK